MDVFRIAERTVSLANPNFFPVRAGPSVHVAEYVPVDTPVMLLSQFASWHRFGEPLCSNRRLETVERYLSSQIATIFENIRSWITIRIVYAVIH